MAQHDQAGAADRGTPPAPGPRWGIVGLVMAVAAVLFTFDALPRTALF